MSLHGEKMMAGVIAGGGLVWAAAAATDHVAGFRGIFFTSGPLEICAIGILVWLHTMWRRSLHA